MPRVPHSVAFPAGRTSAPRISIAAGEQGGLWKRTWLTFSVSFVSHATPLFSLSLLLSLSPSPPPPHPPPRCLARLAAHPALLLLPRPPLWITEVAQRAGELPGGSAEQPLITHTPGSDADNSKCSKAPQRKHSSTTKKWWLQRGSSSKNKLTLKRELCTASAECPRQRGAWDLIALICRPQCQGFLEPVLF